MVTDGDLEHLVRIGPVTELHLTGTAISNRGATTIGRLSELEVLEVGGTGITSPGEFKGLVKLQMLGLAETSMADRAILQLCHLERLWCLDLDGTLLTDRGLLNLDVLQNLELLYLTDTWITDASVPTLGQLSQLDVLALNGTALSIAGLAELRRLLPQCEIVAERL
jgi:hypothetical protein